MKWELRLGNLTVSKVRSYKYIVGSVRRRWLEVTQVLPRTRMIQQVSQPIRTPNKESTILLLTASAEITRLGSQ